jgi:solute carrier family 25 oxoglutarate transporter 11|eukprot:TRINITY_DN60852_c0_g1_i1.p1 TRINITY_DN60852_c0_g1~~TRINITY_DN60852_c0_g1_i1.p1  ORF type:complete len:295 (+),score=40.80 TRINITY_DN60852_c0_g1_i1:98-982(+)
MPDFMDNVYPFALAGLSGASGWLFVHPFDVAKVQMQINQKAGATLLSTSKTIVANEGAKGLYAGIKFAMWRQATYTTSRMGLYDVLCPMFKGSDGKISPLAKAGAGVCAGGIAATCCCPVEVGLVRAQADGRLPPEERRNYRGLFDAVKRISQTEGIPALWRGVGPTVARGAVVSATQLGSYDQAKEMLIPIMGNGFPTFVCSAFASGLIYCTASLPLDITKTRIQNMKVDPATGKMPYSSMLDALVKIPRTEGFFALWKGFPPYFMRSGGHTVFMFLFKEQYTKMYKQARGRE